MTKKKALGKGLGALIDESSYSAPQPKQAAQPAVSNYIEIPLEKIKANPYQPRAEFEEESLQELAESIKRLGIIQPITVKKPAGSEEKDLGYYLISGERRLRAAKIAGLKTIPAFIRKADDQGLLEYALVENIQREDLNAIEVATTYQRLMNECALTQENLSKRVGKKRTTVSNYLRLLKLPPEIQLAIKSKKIGMGHAKALINIEDSQQQLQLFLKTIKEDLSVRKLEEMARNLQHPKKEEEKPKAQAASLPEKHQNFAEALRHSLESKVELKRSKKGKGRIVIPFQSDDDLERIMQLLQHNKEG